MAFVIAFLVVFFAMSGHSRADYCLCKDGVSTTILQNNIDYACGNGANCSPILQNGPCFNPNTVKDHCNWAVNSYYQAKASTGATCNFQGTAQLFQTPPQTASSGCVYPSSPGSTGTPSTNNPSTSPPGSGSTGTLTPLTPPGSSTNSPNFGGGLGPSGSGMTNPDSGSVALNNNLLASIAATIVVTGLIFMKV